MKKMSILLLSLACSLLSSASVKIESAPITCSILPPERAEASWVDIEGDCMIVDDITTGFFDFDQGILIYDVMMQADTNNPGMYRLVNPWQFWPMRMMASKFGASVTVSDDFYIEIDATDPDAVKIYPQDAGLDDGDGPSVISSLYGVYDELNISEIMAIAMSGVLEDNVISFEAPASILLIQGGQGYRTNQSGRFAVILPGGQAPVDYEFTVEPLSYKFMPDSEYKYRYTVDAFDDRIPEIRWYLTTSYPTSDICQLAAEEGNICQIGDRVEVSVEGLDARKAYVIFVSVDEYGDYQESEFFSVYPVAKSESWEYFGPETMTEDFFATFMDDISPETFDVEVEKHKSVDGYYRIKVPFDSWSHADKFDVRDDYPGYIYINITNPQRPYIAESCLGISRSGKEFAISSHYCQRVEMLGLAMVEKLKEGSGGHWENNVLTFDPEPGVFIRESGSDVWTFVNAVTNPECDIDEYIHNPDYKVPRFLNGSFSLDMNRAFSGLTDCITGEQSEEIYFNLQGIRVDKPSAGVYIRRQGSKIDKVLIK